MNNARHSSKDYHLKTTQTHEGSINMIDHAYHISVSSTSLNEAETSATGLIYDTEGEELWDDEDDITEEVDWHAEDVEPYQQEDWNAPDDVLDSTIDWHAEDVEPCQQEDWDAPDDVLDRTIDWHVENVEPCQQEDWNTSDDVLVQDDESSGGEWSVNVLRHNGEWNDTASDESEQSEQATVNGDSTAMVEDDWNVEVLDTETDWNEDIVQCAPVNDWGEDSGSEMGSPAASEDWNVEVLEHDENDWSTDWNDTEDERTFFCALCQKQYLTKSSFTKHVFLVHNQRLSHCRNSVED